MNTQELLTEMNRQYNETNALYHSLAVRLGLSDSAFWVLYALANTPRAYTQNELCSEWGLPKQTLNSTVASLAHKGILVLDPAPGPGHRKWLRLTPAGHALAEKTVIPVFTAEQAALARLGEDTARLYWQLGQDHLRLLRQETDKLPPP